MEKHDFVGGKIYQRAQSSFNHATICGNLLAAAHSRRRGKDYQVFDSDMKVKVEATGASFYPDATIYCPPARFVGKGNHTLLTPKTKEFDRTGK